MPDYFSQQELDNRDASPLPTVLIKMEARSHSPAYKEDMKVLKVLREESEQAVRVREELERTSRVEKELQRVRTKRCCSRNTRQPFSYCFFPQIFRGKSRREI